MLSPGDLEVNVLEFRQRSFQFERAGTVAGREVAVFSRTETETETQFRPKLVHLRVLVPLEWVLYDEPNDLLLIARDGTTPPVRLTEPVVEVGAERTEFQEQGMPWKRIGGPSGTLVYAPQELADVLLTPAALTALGLT
ncbi:MAG: hypothetical protein WBF81_04540 [Thermoplasmata archaeon]